MVLVADVDQRAVERAAATGSGSSSTVVKPATSPALIMSSFV
jgi:hypothetical protein